MANNGIIKMDAKFDQAKCK